MSKLQENRKNKEIEKRKEIAIRRPFDNLFDNFRQDIEDSFFTPLFGPSRYNRMSNFLDYSQMRTPPCDIIDKGDRYLISFEIPGIEKDKMEIKATNEYLTVSAKLEEQMEDINKGAYVLNEKKYASFNRKISFDEDVMPSKIEVECRKWNLKYPIAKTEAN